MSQPLNAGCLRQVSCFITLFSLSNSYTLNLWLLFLFSNLYLGKSNSSLILLEIYEKGVCMYSVRVSWIGSIKLKKLYSSYYLFHNTALNTNCGIILELTSLTDDFSFVLSALIGMSFWPENNNGMLERVYKFKHQRSAQFTSIVFNLYNTTAEYIKDCFSTRWSSNWKYFFHAYLEY